MTFDRLENLPLRCYRPRSQLRLLEQRPVQAAFRGVDVHNHLGRWLAEWIGRPGAWVVTEVETLLELMDTVSIDAIVNLDGRWEAELEANLDRYDRAYPGRFATFCHVDWSVAGASEQFGERLAESLTRSIESGAKGLKVWKDLGLRVRDRSGRILLPDDCRLAPLWLTAGEFGVPVMIHVADPVAFFDPVDERNERLEELLAHPDWSFAVPGLPSFARLMEALEALVATYPRTTFIGAHVGCYAENLGWVTRMLDIYPNFYVDIAGRIGELGRQPRAARALFLRHADRVLFGTDAFPPRVEAYRTYYRFLETDDEHFPYSASEPPPQGRWAISGVGLPQDVLRSVYAANAQALVPCLEAV